MFAGEGCLARRGRPREHAGSRTAIRLAPPGVRAYP